MRNLKFRILLITLLTTFGAFITPTEAFAVIQTSNNTHSLGWQGLLPLSRGGIGVGSFTAGSVLFFNGTSFAQDNSNLFWDITNKRLGIGTALPTSALDVNGHTSISGNLILGSGENSGISRFVAIGIPNTAGIEGGFSAGTTDGSSMVRGIEMNWQNEADPSQSFGYIDTFNTLNGPNPLEIGASVVRLQPGGGDTTIGGLVKLQGDTDIYAVLNASNVTSSDKVFTFPNTSGAFGLLEANQTWNGLNKFEANTNSTIYVGSSVKSGCIAMGDSDGSGVTYLTANDGVLTASATKPSFCQ